MLATGMLKKSGREKRQQESRPVAPCCVSALRLSTCSPGPPVSASPGSLLERQLLSPKLDLLSQGRRGWGRWGGADAFSTQCFNKPSGGLPCTFRWDHHHCTRTTLVVKKKTQKQEDSKAPVLHTLGHLARLQEKTWVWGVGHGFVCAPRRDAVQQNQGLGAPTR